MADYKNILIIKPSAMGDIITALPALHALRSAYPNARITWLVRPEFAALLKNHPELNDIIIFDRKGMGKWFRDVISFRMLGEFKRKLRNAKFDLVVDLQGLFRSGYFAWITGARTRVGLAKSRELARLFYTKTIPWDKSVVHVVDYYLRLASEITGVKAQAEFVFADDSAARMSAFDKLAEGSVDRNNYCVLIPGSAHARKNWPADNFAQLADKINAKFGFDIVTVGSASEKPITQAVATAAKCKIYDLAGRTSIPELTALLQNAKMVVSNDTGPGQMAAAMPVPVVLIFGPSNPIRIHPYGRGENIVAKNPWSRGYAIHNLDPIYNIECIAVDEVFDKVCEIYNKERK